MTDLKALFPDAGQPYPLAGWNVLAATIAEDPVHRWFREKVSRGACKMFVITARNVEVERIGPKTYGSWCYTIYGPNHLIWGFLDPRRATEFILDHHPDANARPVIWVLSDGRWSYTPP